MFEVQSGLADNNSCCEGRKAGSKAAGEAMVADAFSSFFTQRLKEQRRLGAGWPGQ